MSILIDELIDKTRKSNITTNIDHRWYFAKSLGKSLTLRDLFNRLNDAFRVIIGKSFAVHYKEDEDTL